jgi:electron transport complex protein RnfC
MRLWTFNGGVHPEGHKRMSSEARIAQAPIPPILTLPLLQHMGVAATPIVQVGEKVLAGQVIAHCPTRNCDVSMSAPIHASSSGKVIAIEPRAVPHHSGLMAMSIVIETDGLHQWVEPKLLNYYTQHSPLELRQHIAAAGIVGLGGAGFPTHIKLKTPNIETLIINGAECEPYITCDDLLMQEYPHDIIAGANILLHVLGGAKRCIIAIEDNKPKAYAALKAAASSHMEVVKIPTLYPSGGARQLIKILLGIEIGRHQQSSAFGIVMHNIETTRAVYRAVQQGRPLVSRVITVTGDGVAKPQNMEVLLGTPMHTLIDFCGRKPDVARLIMGGAMMGFALPSDELPVIKTTNCLIVYRAENLALSSPSMPCIRCGACAEACPLNLLPQQLYWHARAKDFKKIQDYHLADCIECGCCAYVCPSQLPLVDYYRYAKSEIRELNQAQKAADQAKNRHEARVARLEKEKLARETRHQQLKTAMPPETISSVIAEKGETLSDDAARKKAVIQAALAKAKQKSSGV